MKLSRQEIITMKRYFFTEGVALVEDKCTTLHPELNIREDEVMKLFISLVSRGIARKHFVWRHAYFFITDEGIDMLKNELALENNDRPATHQETTNFKAVPVAEAVTKLAEE